jgi:hypothetical protein
MCSNYHFCYTSSQYILLNFPGSWIFSILILTFNLEKMCKFCVVNSAFDRLSRMQCMIKFETAQRIGASGNLICISIP